MNVSGLKVSTVSCPSDDGDSPAGVKRRGKREKTPATDASANVRKYALFSAASRLVTGQA